VFQDETHVSGAPGCAVYAIERQMVDAVPQRRLAALLADLDRMAAALGG
jgi:hypothetical protein